MKRILYIAPHSFPIKSSESICNSKLAYSLAKSGYKVDVFTCADNSTYPADKELDLFLRTHENIDITTVEPKYILRRTEPIWKLFKSGIYNLYILLKYGFFYNGISIPYLILESVERKIKKYGIKYDYIITRGFHTDLVGVVVAKKYGIKWIANWNDPYPTKRFPAPYGQGYDAKLPYFENKMIESIQKYASVHTFPNPRLRNWMLKCFPLVKNEDTYIMPHMALSLLSQKKNKEHNIIKMVHCGDVKKPRDPKLFLKALGNVKKKYDKNFECYFIGGYDSSINQYILDYGLNDSIKLLPSKNYKDSMDFISQCDIAIIIEAQCEEGIYLPTKVVDSFQCGLPVFCVSPRIGYLRDLVLNYNVGYIADNTSEIDITNSLNKMFSDYEKHNLPEINKENMPYFFEDNIIHSYKNMFSELGSYR